MKSFVRPGLLASFVVSVLASGLMAGTVLQMNLGQMSERAEKIFRGTLLDTFEESIAVGGGRLPTVKYVFRVEESFKGVFPAIKDEPLVELRMVGKIPPLRVGAARRVSVLPDMPELRIGGSYVLFVTAPSSVGLSTTVGLGQGAFRVLGDKGKELVVNEIDNAGLFRGMPQLQPESPGAGTPLTYAKLAAAIRAGLATQ